MCLSPRPQRSTLCHLRVGPVIRNLAITFALYVKNTTIFRSTASLGRAVDSGEVDSVDKWLEIQRLSNYSEHFKQKGIDNLEKVSNLTLK